MSCFSKEAEVDSPLDRLLTLARFMLSPSVKYHTLSDRCAMTQGGRRQQEKR